MGGFCGFSIEYPLAVVTKIIPHDEQTPEYLLGSSHVPSAIAIENCRAGGIPTVVLRPGYLPE